MSTKSEIGSIKTEILVAWIFSLLVLIAWIVGLIYSIVVIAIMGGILGPLGPSLGPLEPSFAGYLLAGGIVCSIVILIFMIPTIMVYNRTNRMRIAANKSNVQQLKKLNSIGWAIVALIFTLIIPGVMLLIAHGPIKDLQGDGFSDETIEKLIKLKSLLDSGVISREEFEQQKAKIKPVRPVAPVSPASNIEEQLKMLKSLLDSGTITQAEYENLRQKVLEKI